MDTSMRPRGRQIECLIGWQADFDAPAPADSYHPLRLYSVNLRAPEPFEEDPLLGAGGNNARDPNDPAPGLRRGSGPFVAPLCLNNLGFILAGLLGAPTTTEEDGVYTHVFSSGKPWLPNMTMEVKPAPGVVHQHVGVALNQARFRLAQEAGFRRVEVDALFRDTNRLSGSEAGDPQSALSLSRVPSARGVARLDGTEIGVLNALDATYENRMTPREHADDQGLISGFDLDEDAVSTIDMTVRLIDGTFAALMGDGEKHAVEIEYPGATSGHKLVLAWPAVRFPADGIGVEGPGGIEKTLNGRAQQTASDPMFTATLVNGIEDYSVPAGD